MEQLFPDFGLTEITCSNLNQSFCCIFLEDISIKNPVSRAMFCKLFLRSKFTKPVGIRHLGCVLTSSNVLPNAKSASSNSLFIVYPPDLTRVKLQILLIILLTITSLPYSFIIWHI